MPREPKEVRQRPLIDDSSSVVLHARHTTFVMLIVSALVVVGILVEDVSRLKRAFDDAETAARYRAEQSSQETGPESVGSGHGSQLAGPPD